MQDMWWSGQDPASVRGREHGRHTGGKRTERILSNRHGAHAARQHIGNTAGWLRA